jgi:hypothetical protein
MDIQVLNEIANPARQASLSQVKSLVSANAQLKALKGNPVPAPGNPAPPALEDSPEQTQAPVTPEISSVARAASAYSVAVGDGLNVDELSAVQDLAGRVRKAVSDFLSQPGLEQAENAVTVVASNPEAVQNLTASVGQAVVETLNLPAVEGEVIVNVAPPNEDVLEEVPASENFVSLERITNGAESNNQVQVTAVSPALVHSRASENTSVENPVTVAGVPEASNREFRVTSASPALQNANAQSVVVGNSVNTENAPETSNGDFSVTAASPALQNAQAGEHAQVETPVSRPDAVSSSNQELFVTAASPALQNAQAQNAEVANPVNVPVPTVDQEQGSVEGQSQTVNSEGIIVPLEEASSQTASVQSDPQPASSSQPGFAQSNGLFAQENAAVNPENIRDVNELVNSVVDNEFTSEVKKIFSEPKVIRTVADLADFILERLREIILTKQQQPQSNGETGLS